MKIRPESLPFVGVVGVPAALFYGLWLYDRGWWWLLGFVVFCLLTVFVVYFFRDPDRVPDSSDPDAWLSPADGVVTRIEEREDGGTVIVIFLTVFNVHVNRMPVEGTVENREYRSGRFLPAFAGDLDELNEQNRLTCRDDRGRSFQVRQIAGMLARRIHCWIDERDPFERGERFGMIAFGSRTDLVLPPGVEPTVSPRQVVRGGRTVVARG